MLEKNYKLAEMIFLEQVRGEEGQDGRGHLGGEKRMKDQDFQMFGKNFKV